MADWDFYKANINEKIASVFLNLEAESDLNITSYPKLCWVFIRLNIERKDGLSHDNEFEALLKYEELLLVHLKEKPIELVGCVTTNGMRQFYFYSNKDFEFEKYAEIFASEQTTHQYQLGEKLDPNWEQYKSVLYPGEFGIEQINERRKNA
jgi:hypothetical protein